MLKYFYPISAWPLILAVISLIIALTNPSTPIIIFSTLVFLFVAGVTAGVNGRYSRRQKK